MESLEFEACVTITTLVHAHAKLESINVTIHAEILTDLSILYRNTAFERLSSFHSLLQARCRLLMRTSLYYEDGQTLWVCGITSSHPYDRSHHGKDSGGSCRTWFLKCFLRPPAKESINLQGCGTSCIQGLSATRILSLSNEYLMKSLYHHFLIRPHHTCSRVWSHFDGQHTWRPRLWG